MSVTFSGNNIISDQLSNRSGNLSQTLFRQRTERAPKARSEGKVKPLASVLERTNPYNWNQEAEPRSGEKNRFNIYMDQARMSTFYQDNPWKELQHSEKHGYVGPTLGGNIRGDIPPGSLPGNTIKPNAEVKSRMVNRSRIEGFENNSSIKWN